MNNYAPDSLNSVIQQLTSDGTFAENIAYLRKTEPKEGEFLEFPPEIHPFSARITDIKGDQFPLFASRRGFCFIVEKP